MVRFYKFIPFLIRFLPPSLAIIMCHSSAWGQSVPKPRCGTLHTPLIFDRSSDELTATALRPEWPKPLGRPTLPGEEDRTNQLGHSYTVEPEFFISSDQQFKIWYVTTSDDKPGAGWPTLGDKNNNEVPDYVEYCATFLDESRQVIVEELGFQPPPVDYQYHDKYQEINSDDGGDGLFDVYIADLSSHFSGYARPEAVTADNAMPSYIVIENDFFEFRQTIPEALELLRITVAHEYFHAVQFGYNAGAAPFWLEQSAVWIEEQVYDDVNDYLNYFPTFSSFLTEPWISLDVADGEHEYAGVLWPIFLETRYSKELIRRIWERTVTNNALDAIDQELQSIGSNLMIAFREFTIWNVFTNNRADINQFYEEGAFYPPVEISNLHDANINGTSMLRFEGPDNTQQQLPSHLAANYICFIPDSTMEGGLHIDFTGISGEWGISVVASGSDIPNKILTAPITSSNITIDVPNWTLYEKIFLIVASVEKTGSSFDYEYKVSFDPGLRDSYQPIAASLITYPNPFNMNRSSSNTVKYQIDHSSEVEITVYNLLGQKVRTLVDGSHSQGIFYTAWDGKNDDGEQVGAGVYFCRLTTAGSTGTSVLTRKLLFLK